MVDFFRVSAHNRGHHIKGSEMKPGVVAYIVRPWMRREDIGRPVTVLRIGVRGQRIAMRGGGISRCEGPGESRAWLCDASGGEFPCFIAEECLRRLGGEEVDAEAVNAGVPQVA